MHMKAWESSENGSAVGALPRSVEVKLGIFGAMFLPVGVHQIAVAKISASSLGSLRAAMVRAC